MTRCLVHLFSASAFLSALAALRTLHPGRDARATLVLHLPSVPDETHRQLESILREFAAGVPEIECVHALTSTALSALCRPWSARQSACRLAASLGPAFDEIYFQHDTSGVFYQLAAAAYPFARRICIGDAFGMVYERRFIESYFGGGAGRARRLLRRARAMLRGSWEALEFPDYPPHLAALVLPVDPSGKYLDSVPLRVCERDAFQEAVGHCVAAVPELARYSSTLLASHRARRRYLLLTEHYAEVGQLPLDKELDMYCAIIGIHCEPGSVVYVKRHPAERLRKGEAIRVRLAGRFDIVLLDPRWMRYPIEIWKDIIRECTPICMAYPILSLRYIYGVATIQPMDEAFIERWFEPRLRAWTRDGLKLYTEPAERLGAWDGRSVLWAPELPG